MTTIAFDGACMVADGRVTSDGAVIFDSYHKLYSCNFKYRDEEGVREVVAFGCSGEVRAIERFVTSLSGIELMDAYGLYTAIIESRFQYPSSNFVTILVFSNGGCAVIDSENLFNTKRFFTNRAVTAIGSGARYLRALDTSAFEVVRRAATHDPRTGGLLTDFAIPETYEA